MAGITHLELDVLMVDDTLHERVRIIGADRQRWTEVSQRHKWPKASEDEDLFVRFLCWAALHRRGDYQHSYDQFCSDVSNYEPTENSGRLVDPTGPATTDD